MRNIQVPAAEQPTPIQKHSDEELNIVLTEREEEHASTSAYVFSAKLKVPLVSIPLAA